MTSAEIEALHHKAMDMAEKADAAQHRGDEDRADCLFHRAYDLERKAAEGWDALGGGEPTRGILFRSAAALALSCGLRAEAVALAERGLAGIPPERIAGELREVLGRARA